MGAPAIQRYDTLQMKADVLEAVEEHYSIVQAAKAAGVARPTVYAWQANDPVFAEALKQAQTVAKHNLEGSLYQRAITRDTIAAIFLLKSMDPAKYQDKLQQRAETTNNFNFILSQGKLSDAERSEPRDEMLLTPTYHEIKDEEA